MNNPELQKEMGKAGREINEKKILLKYLRSI